MVFEHQGEYESQCAPIGSISVTMMLRAEELLQVSRAHLEA